MSAYLSPILSSGDSSPTEEAPSGGQGAPLVVVDKLDNPHLEYPVRESRVQSSRRVLFEHEAKPVPPSSRPLQQRQLQQHQNSLDIGTIRRKTVSRRLRSMGNSFLHDGLSLYDDHQDDDSDTGDDDDDDDDESLRDDSSEDTDLEEHACGGRFPVDLTNYLGAPVGCALHSSGDLPECLAERMMKFNKVSNTAVATLSAATRVIYRSRMGPSRRSLTARCNKLRNSNINTNNSDSNTSSNSSDNINNSSNDSKHSTTGPTAATSATTATTCNTAASTTTSEHSTNTSASTSTSSDCNSNQNNILDYSKYNYSNHRDNNNNSINNNNNNNTNTNNSYSKDLNSNQNRNDSNRIRRLIKLANARRRRLHKEFFQFFQSFPMVPVMATTSVMTILIICLLLLSPSMPLATASQNDLAEAAAANSPQVINRGTSNTDQAMAARPDATSAPQMQPLVAESNTGTGTGEAAGDGAPSQLDGAPSSHHGGASSARDGNQQVVGPAPSRITSHLRRGLFDNLLAQRHHQQQHRQQQAGSASKLEHHNGGGGSGYHMQTSSKHHPLHHLIEHPALHSKSKRRQQQQQQKQQQQTDENASLIDSLGAMLFGAAAQASQQQHQQQQPAIVMPNDEGQPSVEEQRSRSPDDLDEGAPELPEQQRQAGFSLDGEPRAATLVAAEQQQRPAHLRSSPLEVDLSLDRAASQSVLPHQQHQRSQNKHTMGRSKSTNNLMSGRPQQQQQQHQQQQQLHSGGRHQHQHQSEQQPAQTTFMDRHELERQRQEQIEQAIAAIQASESAAPAHENHERPFDVPQVFCNNTDEGFERFACPTPDELGRYRCIEDRLFCDGYNDCPNGEDEGRTSCMYYRLFVSHIDILTNTFLTWMKSQNRQSGNSVISSQHHHNKQQPHQTGDLDA